MKSDKPNVIPLQVNPVYRPTLLRHPAYWRRDDVDLCAEATAYIQGRIPVLDRAVAIAILLELMGRDEQSGLVGCCHDSERLFNWSRQYTDTVLNRFSALPTSIPLEAALSMSA